MNKFSCTTDQFEAAMDRMAADLDRRALANRVETVEILTADEGLAEMDRIINADSKERLLAEAREAIIRIATRNNLLHKL